MNNALYRRAVEQQAYGRPRKARHAQSTADAIYASRHIALQAHIRAQLEAERASKAEPSSSCSLQPPVAAQLPPSRHAPR